MRGLGVPYWGNLRRLRPFSVYYGFDRGTPVDRYYLDRFLAIDERIDGLLEEDLSRIPHGEPAVPLLLRDQLFEEVLHLRVELVHADIRSFHRPDTFELAISMYSSFGYSIQEEDNLDVLREVRGRRVVKVRGGPSPSR